MDKHSSFLAAAASVKKKNSLITFIICANAVKFEIIFFILPSYFACYISIIVSRVPK
jgi:hypothetical protein